MANPDNSGCTVNFADGYLPRNSNSQRAPGQDVLLKLRFPNVVFKESDNFQWRVLKGEDKPEYGGGQNKNDARLGEEKKSLPDIVLALSLKLTPRTYSLSIIHEAGIYLLLAACLDLARALSVVKCVWKPPIPPVAFFFFFPLAACP